jgi:hypothetical protein
MSPVRRRGPGCPCCSESSGRRHQTSAHTAAPWPARAHIQLHKINAWGSQPAPPPPLPRVRAGSTWTPPPSGGPRPSSTPCAGCQRPGCPAAAGAAPSRQWGYGDLCNQLAAPGCRARLHVVHRHHEVPGATCLQHELGVHRLRQLHRPLDVRGIPCGSAQVRQCVRPLGEVVEVLAIAVRVTCSRWVSASG